MPHKDEMTEPVDSAQNTAAFLAPAPRTPGVVGIGTSSSRLEALEKLLTHLPIDSGLAFAVVPHVDFAHESIHADLLSKYTRMPVKQVTEDTFVEPNHVYVIAPNRYMVLQGGVMHALKPSTSRGMRLPIDHFFRSLAEDLGEQAIGILLSGTHADGTMGLETIKEHGGLTIAETPNTAHNDAIPYYAILTGIVDIVAQPEEIAAHIVKYHQKASIPLSAQAADFYRANYSDDTDALQRILGCLQEETGHDFSGYKKNTTARRIERRMTLNRSESLESYIQLLEADPAEVDALFRELLIGVTCFFRDPEAFASLDKNAIGPLFMAHREPWRPIRVWIPGCSSGEEAYSVAILLHEHAARAHRQVEFQIFATDIDQVALDKGRSGRYQANFATDVNTDRLHNYFIRKKDGQTIMVGRQLRDSVVFAAQSVLKDPPFSKIDLICCRNLMIYLGSAQQQRLLSVMHYALNPGGYLFLGNSETLGGSQRLFRTIDQKWKIFQRQEIGSDIKQMMQLSRAEITTKNPPVVAALDRQPTLREMTEQLLLVEHTPTAIVVNGKGDMLYIHGRTGKFLEQTTGAVSTNILKVARDGLRMPLMGALHHVSVHQEVYQLDGIVIQDEQEKIYVRLTVTPIAKPAPMQGMILVTLTEMPPPRQNDASSVQPNPNVQWNRIETLERELTSTRQYLQTTIEEVETTNEELRSTNEDLQSSNEELQSINEELQTSKEELQSVNEELNTLNLDLHDKINDLVIANNDIKNLLDNAQIGMIFLDTKLHIRRFTPAATDIVDLIAADIGRPLAQFVHRLHYEDIVNDVYEVLGTRQAKEMELRALDDRWFLVRVLPYRTLDDNVDGVVLTFTDVTQLKEGKEKLEFLFNALPVGISLLDRERKSLLHNDAFLRMCDLTSDEFAQQAHMGRTYYRPDGTPRPTDEFAVSRVLAGEPTVLNVESGFERRNGKNTWVDVSAIACPFMDWSVVAVTSDITAQKEAEFALKASEEKFSKAFHMAPLGIKIIDLATNMIIECNQRFLDVSGFTREDVIGTSTTKLGWVPVDVGNRLLESMSKVGPVRNEEIVCRAKDGREIDCLYNGFVIELGGRKQVVSMIYDISERKRSEEAIKATLRHEKETVLRELAHRTKNNMFVIRSILNLHAMHTEDEEIRRLFTDVENKIVAMALVHQKLYQSKNLSRLDLGEYLRELAPVLMESYSTTPERVSFNIEAESISALIDTAIPCGLVVTELFSNAFKHAFPDFRAGTISLRLYRQMPNTIHLEISDDGVGVPEGFDFRRQSTLGLETIFMIIEHQLKGNVQFRPSPRGLTCHIEFTDTFYSERV